MNRKNKEYSIGLDIGTSSVGWAVIDKQNKLLKKGNDPLWGYSLFDAEGQSAASRRIARGTRRRYVRRKQRIHLLQDLCSEMIYPVDKDFFKRLENSYLVEEDRDELSKNCGILFADFKSDKEYYKKYPTIYHLRDHLIKTDEKADPRLIYLALHHIVKYRGNFLYEGQSFNSSDNDSGTIDTLEHVLEQVELDTGYAPKIHLSLSNDKETKKDRQKKVKDLGTEANDKKILEEIAKALLGYKFSPDVIIGEEGDKKTSFSDANYDEFIGDYSSNVGDSVEVIYDLQSVYSSLVLKNILHDSDSISKSMIQNYEKHKSDLNKLKELIRPYEDTKKLVLNTLYDKYINNVKEMPRGEFYKALKGELAKLPDSEDKNDILGSIDDDNFLLRQNSTDNGAIPYQIHYAEAKKIIDKQKKYYDCLAQNEDKILSIISFRRPYYLGPSKGGDGTNKWSWMVTNSNDPIRPWNWNEIVDVDETAKKFIDRMRNHCTYILGEETLPKNSVLLGRFNLLNELNKIRFDGKILFAKKADKQNVINGLFLKKDKVSLKDLKKWLVDNQIVASIDKKEITGFQSEDGFASSLKVERAFRAILKDSYDVHVDDVEKMISYITVYNDKEMIKRSIRNNVSISFTDKELDQISKMNLSGYGRFSKKLIDGIVSSCVYKNPNTIIGYMYETSDNFMQILNNNDYGFLEQIRTLNFADDESLSYDLVGNLATSPANKRAIWQSIRVVQDIVKYMEHDPHAIYIEFARNEGKKTRTTSRYKQLEKIYKNISDKELHAELKNYQSEVDSEKVYLYFIQQGKCMYSGKKLNINELDKYQVDHILPQSYIKDDSIENKALVISSENQRKADNMLLDSDLVRKQIVWWRELYEIKMIGPKKYRNLTRNNISEIEKNGFIARQLVETRQICVHVRDILKNAFPNTEVGTVHAPLSSEFRQKYGLYKIRNLNNAHHANDAYLAAMIGSFVSKELPYLFSNGSIETRYINKAIMDRLKEENKANSSGGERRLYSIAINKMGNDVLFDENGEVYWEGPEQIAYIKKIFNLKSYMFNYMTRDYDGSLYNATLYPARSDKKGAAIPSVGKKKYMPVDKYGGYSSIEKAYAMAVEYKKGKSIKREVIDIPSIYAYNPKNYLVHKTGDPDVKCISKIRMNQTFIKDGSLLTMSSASEWCIREPIYLDNNSIELLHRINSKKEGIDISKKDLEKMFFTILKKAYYNIPTLQSVINTKIGCNNNECLFENSYSMENAVALFESLSEIEIANTIMQLLVCITSKSHPALSIGENKIANNFGRLTNKVLKLDEVEFVFTSPSGIYKTIRKL